jgi:hypothetical protein
VQREAQNVESFWRGLHRRPLFGLPKIGASGFMGAHKVRTRKFPQGERRVDAYT